MLRFKGLNRYLPDPSPDIRRNLTRGDHPPRRRQQQDRFTPALGSGTDSDTVLRTAPLTVPVSPDG